MSDLSLDSLVRVKPEDLEAQAATLDSKAALIRQYMTSADGTMNDLLSPVIFEGASAATFRARYQARRDAMLTLADRIEGFAKRVRASAAAVRGADNANATPSS
jgi:WXG100 family type VII secretion target